MNKKIILIVAVIIIAGTILYIESGKVRPGASSAGTEKISVEAGDSKLEALASADKKAGYEAAIEIAGPTGFINAAKDFTLKSLIGKKVILLDFWTYSCINCIRTLPYLTAWYEKYHDAGLEIVGIHTPEFDFEKKYENVKMATEKYGIKYPVVMDSDYGTWTAYGNRYWPHEYLIDLAGYIVHDQVGEGNYNDTEKEIQKLLKQRAEILEEKAVAIPSSTVTVPVGGLGGAMSPEMYFGSARNEYLGKDLRLEGDWDIQSEFAKNKSAGSPAQTGEKITLRYQASGVYFVAGSASAPIDIEVLRDSKPLDKSAAGEDIFFKDGKSFVRVSEKRLYRLIDDTSPGTHLMELIIHSPGLEAYTFTFG